MIDCFPSKILYSCSTHDCCTHIHAVYENGAERVAIAPSSTAVEVVVAALGARVKGQSWKIDIQHAAAVADACTDVIKATADIVVQLSLL